MSDRIYLLDKGKSLGAMDESPYDSEALLQTLLADHPDVLAAGGSERHRWLLISREVAVPEQNGTAGKWSLDHVFVDQAAIPTLVEVKRSSDTRIRREVVGQLLDYAANAVAHWQIETVRARFEATCEQRGQDAETVLEEHLAGDQEAEEFWRLVKTNLQAGRIRMVFVADIIPAELRSVIEFLNGQMDPAEVIGIEIRQFVGQGQTTLVPRVVGQTATASLRKSPGAARREPITETDFKQSVQDELTEAEARAELRLLAWAHDAGHEPVFSRGAHGAVCSPVVRLAEGAVYPFPYELVAA